MTGLRRISALLLAIMMLAALLPASAEEVIESFGETPESFSEVITEPITEPTDDPTAPPSDDPACDPIVEPTTEPTVEPTPEPTVEPTAKPTTEPIPEATAAKAVFKSGLARLSGGSRLYEHKGLWGAYVETVGSGVVYASEQSDDESAIRVVLNNGASLWEGWVKAEAVTMLSDEQTSAYDREERDKELVRVSRGHELLPIRTVSSEPTATPEPVVEDSFTGYVPLITPEPEAESEPEVSDAPPADEEQDDEPVLSGPEEDEVFSDTFVEALPEVTAEPIPEPSFEPMDAPELDKFVEYRALNIPGNLTASHNRLGKLTVRWEGTSDADAYQLLYKASWQTDYSVLAQTTSTSYSTSDLDPSTVYYFRVRSIQLDDSGKVINQSPQSESMPYIVLGDATIKDPRGKDTSTIRLEWSEVPGANRYDVMMSIHGANEWSIVRTDLTGELCDIANISFDETYDFRVIPKRVLANGTVITGNSSRVIMVGSPMETPSFQNYEWTETGVKLTWDAIPGASGYVIYRRAFSEPDVTNYTKLVVLDEPVTTYVDTAMDPGEVYYYFVYSFKTCSPEGWRCFSLKGEIGMGVWLPKPADVKGENLLNQGVRLSWTPTTGANYYDVHISSVQGETPAADGRVSTAYGYHTSAQLNRTYYYRVRPVRIFSNGDVSTGPWSDEYAFTYQQAQPTYRALLVGNTYPNEDNYLPGCDNDARAMASMLSRMSATPYSTSVQLNLSDSGIINAISSTFSGATSNDVSLFYFSGHGANSAGTNFHGALVGAYHTYLSVGRLKECLDAIPGKKVVIIDTCHSGQMIGKSMSDTSAEASAFNSLVISTFASDATVEVVEKTAVQPAEDGQEIFTNDESLLFMARGENDLANEGYYVLTAAHSTEQSVTSGYDSNSDGKADRYFGLFTYGLCHGSGWNNATNTAITTLNADRDANGAITLYEAYVYAKAMAKRTNPNQTAQMYPDNSAMVIWGK